MMMKNPAVLHALLSHLACNIADYVCYQIDAGAQVVQLFDSWAHHLNPSQFATFSLPYAEEVIQRVRKRHADTPVIFHANGGKLLRILYVLLLNAFQSSRESRCLNIIQSDLCSRSQQSPLALVCLGACVVWCMTQD